MRFRAGLFAILFCFSDTREYDGAFYDWPELGLHVGPMVTCSMIAVLWCVSSLAFQGIVSRSHELQM